MNGRRRQITLIREEEAEKKAIEEKMVWEKDMDVCPKCGHTGKRGMKLHIEYCRGE